MKLPALEQLEERIGYHFQDTYLLSCALTHSSWANEQNAGRRAVQAQGGPGL